MTAPDPLLPVQAVPIRAGMLWVEGPDAAAFLQGLLSQDLAALAVGGTASALLLSERGHIRAEVWVLRDQTDGFTLVTDPEHADIVAETFERLHFTEDLDIIGPEVVDGVLMAGGPPADAEVCLPGPVAGTVRAFGDAVVLHLATEGDHAAAVPAWEAVRIAAGVPTIGIDTGPKTLVQEAGLEGSHVSFAKGCYLGQETVSRAQHRGGVRKTLRRLESAAPLPVGADVTLDGKVVGTVTSTAAAPDGSGVALAMLRTTVEDGATVDVGESSARVTARA